MKDQITTLLIAMFFLLDNNTFSNESNKVNYPEGFTPKASSALNFIENKGQIHDQNYRPRPDVLFGGADGNLIFHLKSHGISYQLSRVDSWKEENLANANEKLEAGGRKVQDKKTIYRLDVNWMNSNTDAKIVKGKTYEGFNNYYLENCPNGVLNVKSYKDITYQNIYTGIDLKWYQKDDHLKYDYLVAAGANYKQIQLELKGAEKINLNSKGELVIKTPLGNIIEEAPLVIQNGKTLKARWVISNTILSFDIENADPNKALIIDPAIRVWGTYYGGASFDEARGCTTDGLGNVYLAGYTYQNSGIVIATSGGHQTTSGGNHDAFLVQFNSAGVRQWGTYYGGAGEDVGRSCATDVFGNVYLSGQAESNSGTVIATPGSYQPTYGGGSFYDAFLVQFNSAGVRQWGTYYGGTGWYDIGYSCATDAKGNVYLAGQTQSTGTLMASVGSHQNTFGGSNNDAFLAKFNSAGARLWATYYGGTSDDIGYSCSVDAAGNVYLAGYTDSNIGTVIATAGAHQSTYGGSSDAFLVKFDSLGVRQWGTYYGGGGQELGYSCATDIVSGNVYLSGETSSNASSVISTSGSHQTTYGGSVDAFLVKFNSSGIRQWGTYYGGAGQDYGYSCITDTSGNVYTAGYTSTNTSSIIATAGSHQITLGGFSSNAFLVQLNSSGVRQWGTYYGGSGQDYGYICATDLTGNVYLAGHAESTTGTVIATGSGHQTTLGGTPSDAFLVKFFDCKYPAAPINLTPLANNNICSNSSTTLSAISGTSTINWFAAPTSTTVLSTGTIYITSSLVTGIYTYYTSALTCASSLTRTAITVTVNANPTVTVNSGSICIGQSYTMNATGANTYTYSSGSAVVSPTANASYTVVGTSILGCESAPVISNITINPLPIIIVNTSDSIICGPLFQGTATLTATGANTYTWNPGGAGTSIAVSPSITSTYSVTGIDINGCVNFSVFTLSVSPCSGISEITLKNNEINIYPNPTTGKITLRSELEITDVKLIDVTGRIIFGRENILSDEFAIDISEQPAGVYILEVSSDKNVSRTKLIKN